MPNFKKTKFACFYTYLALSSVFVLPPVLFVTFREMYGISYTLLGSLVLTNFCVQLTVDLIFSFFAKHFNIHKTVRVMPLLTAAGLVVYALVPTLWPHLAYAGLLIGTVIFSVAAGLCEVLLSPLVAALPSKTPERDMSLLHSLYGWGVLTVVLISTAFLQLFGAESWMLLVLLCAILPLGSFVLFCTSPLPEMSLSHAVSGGRRGRGLLLCVLCIFLGSAAENTMSNWISVYMESALLIPKAVGDILGLALFALLLIIARTWYGRRGGRIEGVLLFSMIGAVVCYLVACLSPWPMLSVVACVLTGLCTSMLWPGALILMEEWLPGLGVSAYALMAAGGDLGASVAPQLLGIVVDTVSASEWGAALADTLALTPEQMGMKAGMLLSSLFPLCGIAVVVMIIQKRKSTH